MLVCLCVCVFVCLCVCVFTGYIDCLPVSTFYVNICSFLISANHSKPLIACGTCDAIRVRVYNHIHTPPFVTAFQ